MDQKNGAEASPEKKLLEVIEKTGQAGSAETIKSGAVHALPRKKAFSLPLGAFNVKALMDSLKGKFSGGGLQFDIKTVNRILAVLAFIFAAYSVMYVIYNSKAASEKMKLSFEDMSRGAVKNMPVPGFPVSTQGADYLASFLERLKRRDLFKLARVDKKSADLPAAEPKGAEMIKALRLVGTSIAVDPKDTYAMIEDGATKMTYFLKKNDSILGAKVTDIRVDRVILSYQENQIELR